MICTRLEGGLGNQLFQYAAARTLAIRLNTEVILDTSSLLHPSGKSTRRDYELSVFKIQARTAKDNEIKYINNFLRFPCASRLFTKWCIFRENSLTFDKKFDELSGDIYLKGYWQSFYYFDSISSYINAELIPNKSMSEKNCDLTNEISGANSVALHVRRGDYVTLAAASSMHGTLPLSYYKTAIDDILGKLKNPVFYVFSDDSTWCMNNLPLPRDSTFYISHNTGKDSWQDLILMSHCHHTVIANSSFSWWAAWLADQRYGTKSRLVFAPARWFAGTAHDTQDRFPAHWISK